MSEVTALQAALAAEQATLYGYGISGSLLRGADRGYASAALQAHLLVRDRLMSLITTLGSFPRAARSAYQLPFPVTDPASARALAARLEESTAGAMWDLVAASPANSPTRSLAITWLADGALRASRWGAQQALPGQPA
jgi:hypothetical protein